jgi:nicotinamide mononucleotide transporter
MSAGEWRVFSITVLSAAGILGYILHNFTDASLPWPDAILTSLSLGAQWMVAKVRRENWWIWIVVNAAYIPLYIYKSLPLTAGLYLVFLLLAVHGLRTWKLKLYNHGTTAHRTART